MKLTFTDECNTILVAKEEEIECHSCKNKELYNLHYCEQEKKLYCFSCLVHNKGCQSYTDHEDFKIKEVQIHGN